MNNNNHKPSNLPAAVRPSLQEMEPRSVRQATALDEIRGMHEDVQRLTQDLSAAYREIDSRGNKIELLENELAKAQDGEKVYRRKLIPDVRAPGPNRQGGATAPRFG